MICTVSQLLAHVPQKHLTQLTIRHYMLHNVFTGTRSSVMLTFQKWPLSLGHKKEKVIHLQINPTKPSWICITILEPNLKEVYFTTQMSSLVLHIYHKEIKGVVFFLLLRWSVVYPEVSLIQRQSTKKLLAGASCSVIDFWHSNMPKINQLYTKHLEPDSLIRHLTPETLLRMI